MSQADELREHILRTEVRVKTAKAGGSGTIIYSRGASTYVLTCHHVVDDAITVREEWDSTVGRMRKKEYRQIVAVEFFDWDASPHGRRPLTTSVDGEIVAYDKAHDMALVRLRMVREAPRVAQLYPPERIEEISVGDPCYACGCALLHDPILTQGHVTHMGDEIDYKLYWMASAGIIFGSSGGAVFVPYGDGCAFIGIPSRIDIAGWASPVPHLGYFAPISRVYEFFGEQLYHFLIPGHAHDEAICADERDQRESKERRRLLLEAPEAAAEGIPDPSGTGN